MSQPKFSIPILPTLITNFYTPAPVIYPPGSDPKVMDQSSVSMDSVDPCVVALLRSEVVVVEKVDLTASEHAGVALSEHATKVSNSTSSTSSTVVAPQALNNVVVAKIETKTDNFMASDSAKAFMKHMEGKMDVKTTQMVTSSSTINQETTSPVASVILDQETEKKNQELHNITQNVIVSTVTEQEASSSVASDTLYQQKEALDDDSLFVCAIPPSGQYYKKLAMVEVDESLFKEPIPVKHGAQKMLKISEQKTIPMEESNSAVIEKNTAWCEKSEKVPKLPSTVVEPVTTPLTNNLKVVNPNVCNFVRCELCEVSCNTRDVFNKHIAGKKHQKKLKRTALEGKSVILEGSKRKVNDSLSNNEGADSKRPKTDQEGAGGTLVACNVCNVGCYGFTAYKLHLASSEHIVMALKHAAGGSMGKV